MHKMIVLYPKSTDPDHYRDYYVHTHLPLVDKLPGLLGRRYSFEVAAPAGESPYFAIFEADFESAEALAAALSSAQGRAVGRDVPNYATGGAVILHYPVI